MFGFAHCAPVLDGDTFIPFPAHDYDQDSSFSVSFPQSGGGVDKEGGKLTPPEAVRK